jgi:hypothetical protein
MLAPLGPKVSGKSKALQNDSRCGPSLKSHPLQPAWQGLFGLHFFAASAFRLLKIRLK